MRRSDRGRRQERGRDETLYPKLIKTSSFQNNNTKSGVKISRIRSLIRFISSRETGEGSLPQTP